MTKCKYANQSVYVQDCILDGNSNVLSFYHHFQDICSPNVNDFHVYLLTLEGEGQIRICKSKEYIVVPI